MVVAALLIVALAFAVGAWALLAGKPEPTGVDRSLALIQASAGSRQILTNELPAQDRLVEPMLDRLRGLANVMAPTGTTERLHRMLEQAGNPAAWTVDRVMGAKGACLLLGGVLGFLYGGGFSLKGVLIGVALAAVLFFLPDLLIYNTALKRREQVRKGLAEAMDMLTVCVEAGQGFDAALSRVARSIEGPIAGEFARAISEVQMGRSRGEAFAGLAERVDAPEVRNFVTALVQADRLGLPVAAVLREQTKAMRLARKQRAEEKAQQVTVKILFPLMLCILPALFIVVIGPGVIRLIGVFSGPM